MGCAACASASTSTARKAPAGGHWWVRLAAADIKACRLPDPCEGYRKPAPW